MSDHPTLPGTTDTSTQGQREGSGNSFEKRIAHVSSAEALAAKPPLHWPTASAVVAQREWPLLIDWVEKLQLRFEVLDQKAILPCWYKHPSLVGALQALRDHERLAYSTSAPATAGVDWHRALRDIEAQIKQWVNGELACSETQHIDRAAKEKKPNWEEFVELDIQSRRESDALTAAERGEREETAALVNAGVISSNGTIFDDGEDVRLRNRRSRRSWRPDASPLVESGGASTRGGLADSGDESNPSEEKDDGGDQ